MSYLYVNVFLCKRKSRKIRGCGKRHREDGDNIVELALW